MINARSEEHYGGYDLNYGGNCVVNSSYRDVDGAYGMFSGCDRLADAWSEVVDRGSVTVDGWSVMVNAHSVLVNGLFGMVDFRVFRLNPTPSSERGEFCEPQRRRGNAESAV